MDVVSVLCTRRELVALKKERNDQVLNDDFIEFGSPASASSRRF